MDNQTQDLSGKKTSNPYAKGVDKVLAQAGEAHATEAIQAGVPIQDILSQLQQLSQTQVPASKPADGGMMSGMQGLVPAILQAVQGNGFNPMQQKTQNLGFDNAAKVMGLQQTMGKNQMDAQKQPLEMQKLQADVEQQPLQTQKLKTEIEQMQPGFQKQGMLSANDIFTKYQQSVQPYVVQRDAYSRIKASGQDPSPAGDLAIIYGYMKMLDPGSTVREGEFATAGQAGSVPQRLVGLYNKVVSGKRLEDAQRSDFLNRSERIFKAADSQYRGTRKQFTKLAIANKLDPEATIQDFSMSEESNNDNSSGVLGRLGLDPNKYELVEE